MLVVSLNGLVPLIEGVLRWWYGGTSHRLFDGAFLILLGISMLWGVDWVRTAVTYRSPEELRRDHLATLGFLGLFWGSLLLLIVLIITIAPATHFRHQMLQLGETSKRRARLNEIYREKYFPWSGVGLSMIAGVFGGWMILPGRIAAQLVVLGMQGGDSSENLGWWILGCLGWILVLRGLQRHFLDQVVGAFSRFDAPEKYLPVYYCSFMATAGVTGAVFWGEVGGLFELWYVGVWYLAIFGGIFLIR